MSLLSFYYCRFNKKRLFYNLGVAILGHLLFRGSYVRVKLCFHVVVAICNIDLIMKMCWGNNGNKTKATKYIIAIDNCYIHSFSHFKLLVCLQQVILTYTLFGKILLI